MLGVAPTVDVLIFKVEKECVQQLVDSRAIGWIVLRHSELKQSFSDLCLEYCFQCFRKYHKHKKNMGKDSERCAFARSVDSYMTEKSNVKILSTYPTRYATRLPMQENVCECMQNTLNNPNRIFMHR